MTNGDAFCSIIPHLNPLSKDTAPLHQSDEPNDNNGPNKGNDDVADEAIGMEAENGPDDKATDHSARGLVLGQFESG